MTEGPRREGEMEMAVSHTRLVERVRSATPTIFTRTLAGDDSCVSININQRRKWDRRQGTKKKQSERSGRELRKEVEHTDMRSSNGGEGSLSWGN